MAPERDKKGRHGLARPMGFSYKPLTVKSKVIIP